MRVKPHGPGDRGFARHRHCGTIFLVRLNASSGQAIFPRGAARVAAGRGRVYFSRMAERTQSRIAPQSQSAVAGVVRVDLARPLPEGDDLVARDEFTSVINRRVARIDSHAVQKFIRCADRRSWQRPTTTTWRIGCSRTGT
jgi:hypothetical protein